MSKNRKPNKLRGCIVCGRAIGKITGWDQADTFCVMLYGFVPAAGYVGPIGDIEINFENGMIKSFNDDGTVGVAADLIDAIKRVPVDRTA